MSDCGSGCGAVGRAVASDTRGPGFESSHRQLLLNIYLLLTVCRKDENKGKEAGNGPFFFKKKSVIVAQLAKRSFTTSVDLGSNQKIANIIDHFSMKTVKKI